MTAAQQQQGEERRDKFRRSDMAIKIIFVLFGIIQAGIGWGLREIYTSMKEHDRSITILQTDMFQVKKDADNFKSDIDKKFERIDDKLDLILRTGILNDNGRGHNGKNSFNLNRRIDSSGVLAAEISGAKRAASAGDDL